MDCNIVIVSPHPDDAIFSCSELMRTMKNLGKRVTVINIFTYDDGKEHQNPFLNYGERNRIDSQCLESMDLEIVRLNYPELLFRLNIESMGFFRSAYESAKCLLTDDLIVERIYQDILEYIVPDTTIYIPMAMDFHPDHQIAYRLHRYFPNNRIYLYEDYPHNISCWKYIRFLGIQYIDHTIIPIDRDDKLAKIMMYGSQIEPLFGDGPVPLTDESYYRIQ